MEFSHLASLAFIIFQVCLGFTKANENESIKLCQNGTAEVVFILDASSSVTKENFDKELAFVKQSIRLLLSGQNAIRVALVTYSTDVNIKIHLSENATQRELLKLIEQVSYDKGETYTRSALLKVYQDIIPSSRSDVPQILILVTDGRSSVRQDGSPLPIAKQMKKEGVKIIVVGVTGKIDEDELVNIASEKSFFMINNFDQLQAIYRDITKETCKTIKITPKPPILCEKNQLEVIFLIDSSKSISQTDFKSELTFVRRFVRILPIGKEEVHMALLTFHDEAHIEFNLNAHYLKNDIDRATSRIRHYGGGTSIGHALRLVRTQVLSEARPDVPSVVLLITDGRNTGVYRPLKEAHILKTIHKTRIIVIGVSDLIDLYKLKQISSSGKIHQVASFKQLARNISSLAREVCQN